MLSEIGAVNQSIDEFSPRLSDVLFESSDRSFGSLAALPSNIEAIEAALLFSTGYIEQVAIVGPSGWGKSHLLEVISHRLKKDFGVAPERHTAAEGLAGAVHLDPNCPLLLDDVQEVLTKPRTRMELRMLLERRVRGGRPTALSFTMPAVCRSLKSLLPNSREWTYAEVRAAEPAERILLLNQLSHAEGLRLSPALVNILAYQMAGNGRTISGALKRLRLEGEDWSDPAQTLRACGLLDPFFADSPDWDLRRRILKVSHRSKHLFPGVDPLDLALFTMLRLAGLAESGAAQAAGIAPAEAYQAANRFARAVRQDAKLAHTVGEFVEMVVASLVR